MENSTIASNQHDLIGIVKQEEVKGFKPNKHPDTEWFRKGGNVGLFVHFGVSSIHGNIDLSWGMMMNTPWDSHENNKNKLEQNKYFKLANSFNPENYNPKKWLKAAKEAGFTYAVLTTKHHDGYALWPSESGEFDTGKYMNGRDLVGEFIKACRECGLKVGLYYSPPDWYYLKDIMPFEYFSFKKWNESPNNMTVEIKKEYVNKVHRQIIELLTNYGKIDILWFDGVMTGIPHDKVISFEEMRTLQPGILVNERLHGYGDFVTPERIVTEIPEKVWEKCEIWEDGDTWGYTEGKKLKSAKWLYDECKSVFSKGGNYLLNVPPSPNGDMSEEFYLRLNEFKKLMKVL